MDISETPYRLIFCQKANPEVKAQLLASRDKFTIPPDAIVRAVTFAIEQPADVDVNEIIVCPTEAQA
jgi:NADP-dependent 3-hydroxy acid dehydrogenase YdfG